MEILKNIFNFNNTNNDKKLEEKISKNIINKNEKKNNKPKEKNYKNYSLCDFEWGRPIYRGNWGPIYIAKHRLTDYVVVIKCMEKNKIVNNNLVEQINGEIQIHSNLKHPNIVEFYGHFEDFENVYLILEFLYNGNLYDYLLSQPNQKIEEKVVANIINQLIETLMYLHEKKIIHRDIKPENLLISDKFQIKLADFGWSIYNPKRNKKRRTLCGTYFYIAPEVFLDKYDHRVDIWDIGVLTYELVSGNLPFGDDKNEKTKNNIINVFFEYPNYFSKELINFLSKILVKNPNKRETLKNLKNHKWIKNNLIN